MHEDNEHFAKIEAEIRRLRGLINDRADFHLYNWGGWRRASEEVGRGYPKHSTGMGSGGISGDDAFDHLCEDADRWTAEVCEAIISGLSLQHRTAISAVYEASVWRPNRGNFKDMFVDAVAAFWRAGARKGLV